MKQSNMQGKLNVHARNVTSQHGEDGILAYIIEVLRNRIIPVACEFGAWDGIFASNVYELWHNRGWKAILIEGDARKCDELRENIRNHDVQAYQQYITAMGPGSLDDLFRKEGINPKIGVLSIDIDSFDYHVWKNLTYVEPQIVVIEFNQNIPPHLDYHDPVGSVYLKCSAKALERLGYEKGFRLLCCTKVNAIFVHHSLFDGEHFPDKPVEYLFDYSELKPQVIFTGEAGNMYPVFSKKARTGMKVWWRLYYWLSALPKRRRTFRSPPREVIEQLRRMGMDA